MKNCASKICTKCKEEKELLAFNKNQDWCKLCKRAYEDANKETIKRRRRRYYVNNREAIIAKVKIWSKANYERVLDRVKKWKLANREKVSAGNKRYRELNPHIASAWRKANRDKRNAAEAKREAKKIRATPPWLTKEDFMHITDFYIAAKGLAHLAGCALHVDHIIPLQGKEVCGLHVPWNLQLLTEEENIKKGNRYEDDKRSAKED